jgi:Flp pilus assembly protein TadG
MMRSIVRCALGSASAFGCLLRESCGVAALEMALTLPVLVLLMMGMSELYFYIAANLRVEAAAQLTADLMTRQKQMNTGTGPASSTSMSDIIASTLLMLNPLPTSAGSAGSTVVAGNPKIDIASILFANPNSGNNNLSAGNAAVNAVTCTAPQTTTGNDPANYCVGIDWEYVNTGAATTATSTSVYQNYATGCTQASLTSCYCVLSPSSINSASTTAPTCQANQSMIYVRIDYTYTDPIAFVFPIIIGSNKIVITQTAYLIPRLVAYIPICTSSTTCA